MGATTSFSPTELARVRRRDWAIEDLPYIGMMGRIRKLLLDRSQMPAIGATASPLEEQGASAGGQFPLASPAGFPLDSNAVFRVAAYQKTDASQASPPLSCLALWLVIDRI